jgi:Type II secretion system (T2SS), protein E, N-terminal domain
MGKLGQLLVGRGWISVQQLTRALQNQNTVGGRLGTCLLEMEVLGEDLLARSLSEQLGVPAAVIEDLRAIPDEVLRLLPEKLARRCRAIPFRAAGGRLDVAMQDPRNLVCQDEIAFATGRRVKVHVLHELRIAEAMQRYYREEAPARMTFLLDRLNRARYLWAGQAGGAAAAEEELGAPGAPGGAATDEERTEVLSVLPLEDLLPGTMQVAPSPLPEPSSPPSQPRRRSLFRTRGGAPAAPPQEPGAGGAPGGGAGAGARARDEWELPPLAELDLRTAPLPSRTGAEPRPEREAQAPAPVQPGVPAETPVAKGPAAKVPATEVSVGEVPAEAAAPREAVPAAPEAAAPGGARETVDLEATLAVGPPPAAGGMLPKVPLTSAERAELGLEPAEPTPPAAEPAPPATLDEVEQAFAATTDRAEVGRILLSFLASSFRRVALFQTTGEQVAAWMAHGDGIDQEAFARYKVSWKEPSVFLNLRQGSGIHLGPLPPMAAHRELALCWGGGLPRDCVVLPVRMRDRLVTVIYADGGKSGLGGMDLEQMQRLAAATAAAFERCILSKKRGYAQS